MATPNAMDLAALYAFAEREALSRLCDVLDKVRWIATPFAPFTELVAAARPSNTLENSLASKRSLPLKLFPLAIRKKTYNIPVDSNVHCIHSA